MPFTRLWRMRSFCSSVQRLLADPLAREVHHRVDAFERGRVDQPGLGIPPDVVARGDAAALQPQHPVTGPAELAARALPMSPLAPLIDDVHPERYPGRRHTASGGRRLHWPAHAPLAQLVRASDS